MRGIDWSQPLAFEEDAVGVGNDIAPTYGGVVETGTKFKNLVKWIDSETQLPQFGLFDDSGKSYEGQWIDIVNAPMPLEFEYAWAGHGEKGEGFAVLRDGLVTVRYREGLTQERVHSFIPECSGNWGWTFGTWHKQSIPREEA